MPPHAPPFPPFPLFPTLGPPFPPVRAPGKMVSYPFSWFAENIIQIVDRCIVQVFLVWETVVHALGALPLVSPCRWRRLVVVVVGGLFSLSLLLAALWRSL